MSSEIAPYRHVWDMANLEFVPFNRYGKAIPKLFWAPLSFDHETGEGCFSIKFEPGGVSKPHEHLGFEEMLILEGELVDHDGVVYKKGQFVSLEPGTTHYSASPNGCQTLAFYRRAKAGDTGQNRPDAKPGELSWGKPVGEFPNT